MGEGQRRQKRPGLAGEDGEVGEGRKATGGGGKQYAPEILHINSVLVQKLSEVVVLRKMQRRSGWQSSRGKRLSRGPCTS